MKPCLALLALAASCPGIALAQSYTVEDMARITDQHVARFDAGSASRNGDMLAFDVKVAWKNPGERIEGEPLTRVVRYLARCEGKELAVGTVTLYDDNRRVTKRIGVPPGAWEFSRPAKGTQESRWIEDVCDLPL